jgi:hypothetical protein
VRVLPFLFLSLAVLAANGFAVTRLESGEKQVSVLELYTSEGCSSCPPAETWMEQHYGGLAEWRRLIPVTFHVDYWDQLGWKDRFAKHEFTVRQQVYADSWNHSAVYTPCFVLNGREWRDWFRGGVPSGDLGATVGQLVATVEGDRVEARFAPTTTVREYRVFVAPMALRASSEVRAGENQGRRLTHDFVALSLVSAKMGSRDSAFGADLQVSTGGARAIAIWVTVDHSLVPIQAVGGLLEQP